MSKDRDFFGINEELSPIDTQYFNTNTDKNYEERKPQPRTSKSFSLPNDTVKVNRKKPARNIPVEKPQDLGFIDSQFFEKEDDKSMDKQESNRNKKLSSAQEFAESYRKEKKINYHLNVKKPTQKVDSFGFRVPSDLKVNFTHMLDEDVVQLLANLIICDRDGIIALNKPYGLASQMEASNSLSLEKLLPRLAEVLRLKESLHMVHRLDKETSGVILLAKTPSMAHLLKEAFKKHEVLKTYLCITVGVPQPSEGVINIPLKKVEVNGNYKMMLRPKYNATSGHKYESIMRHYGHSGSKEAMTHYTVLDAHHGLALVQCRPVTGITHQIRAHLAFALDTPILGDHKYSHETQLIPQQLPNSALKLLGIRQSKARYLPLHLHSYSLVLGPQKGEILSPLDYDSPPTQRDSGLLPNFYATSPFPSFFLKNLKYCRLNFPKTMSILKSRIL